jgi:hypothetical protein
MRGESITFPYYFSGATTILVSLLTLPSKIATRSRFLGFTLLVTAIQTCIPNVVLYPSRRCCQQDTDVSQRVADNGHVSAAKMVRLPANQRPLEAAAQRTWRAWHI